MKISKIKTVAALTAMTVLLSGCDAPYELTETEEGIITNYAAHVVTKFNTDQDQGLTYVDQSTLEDTEEPEDVAVPEDIESSTEMQMVPGAGGQSDEGNVADAGATGLTDLFGTDAVSVDYAGAELTPSYVEDTYYAVDADAGKTYLVLKFNLTNNGTENADVDLLAGAPSFRIKLADGTSAKAELTMLLEDFSTYQGTISAGETKQTVLLFQVPDTMTEVSDFTLEATMNGTSYQIVL